MTAQNLSGSSGLVPVLMYHDVSDSPAQGRFRRFVVPPALFAEHLAALSEAGYRAERVSRLRGGPPAEKPGPLDDHTLTGPTPSAERLVFITFDDGFGSVVDHALPALTARDMTATLFLPTAFVGGRAPWLAMPGEPGRPMLAWQDARDAAAAGFEIGSHGLRHRELDTLDTHELEHELVASKTVLEEKTAGAVQSLAYPYGYHDRRVREATAQAGYRVACEVGYGLHRADGDPLRVRRLLIGADTTGELLLKLVAEGRPTPGQRVRRDTRLAWRLARRARAAVAGPPDGPALSSGPPQRSKDSSTHMSEPDNQRQQQEADAGQGAVTVIICSHQLERWDWLQASVQSVTRQTFPVHETVVVIDGNAGLAKLAVEQLSSTCTVLVRDVCGGLSEARNSGLTVVTTPFVAFFDDDAEAEPDWLERLMEPLADPNVLGVGGHSMPEWERGEPAWFPPELLWVVGCSYVGLPLTAAPVRNVFGGCAVYRRELFDTFGGFRSDFGRHEHDADGCEETEFCMRVSAGRAGGQFIYDPQAVIRHHVPAYRANVRYVIKRSFADGRSKTILASKKGNGASWRKLGTEFSYARENVSKAFLAGIRHAGQGDTMSLARSGVLAISMSAAACGFVSGLAGVARYPHRRADQTTPQTPRSPASAYTDADGNGSSPSKATSTEPAPTDVSVVLCAYTEERWDDVTTAIASLHAQTLQPKEIILVIDYNDRLFERAQTLPGVVALKNTRAQGASGSRNTGVEAATGSIIAFLDDDAQADPEWLAMLTPSYADTSVAGVGGCIDPIWPTEAPRWFPEEFNWVVGCTFLGTRTTTGPVRNLIGANMSVRREVWERVRGFKEGFGNVKTEGEESWAGESRASTAEDTEFCIRVSQELGNSQWIYEPRARVRHRVPGHRCGWRYFLSRSREEGLGKAVLVSAVGRENALAAEISYARHTLPVGVLRGLRQATLEGDIDGLRRSGAIVAGLSAATAGFVERWARSRFATRH